MNRPDYEWLVVTPDKFELPIFSCTDLKILAEKLGVKYNTVWRMQHRGSVSRPTHLFLGMRYRVIRVDVSGVH